MTALVTGGLGFIGGRLVAKLHSRCDVQLANEVLAWRAETDWDTSVETVAWLGSQESVLALGPGR